MILRILNFQICVEQDYTPACIQFVFMQWTEFFDLRYMREKSTCEFSEICDFAAPERWDQSATYHLYACYNGVGQVHLCERNIATEQCCDYRHEYAYAAFEEAHHRRFRINESQHEDSCVER